MVPAGVGVDVDPRRTLSPQLIQMSVAVSPAIFAVAELAQSSTDVMSQKPPEHPAPAHEWPQAPQLLGSVCRSALHDGAASGGGHPPASGGGVPPSGDAASGGAETSEVDPASAGAGGAGPSDDEAEHETTSEARLASATPVKA
jgi:hypothetical protein